MLLDNSAVPSASNDPPLGNSGILSASSAHRSRNQPVRRQAAASAWQLLTPAASTVRRQEILGSRQGAANETVPMTMAAAPTVIGPARRSTNKAPKARKANPRMS